MQEFSSIQRTDLIREVCAGKRVLHLGCTNYPYTEEAIRSDMLLHFDLQKVAVELTGIDSDPKGIAILEQAGARDLFLGDLESLDSCSLRKQFDVVLAGEVIEHLNNPGLFLEGVKRFLAPSGKLVITTVNTYCAMRFVQYGLRGRKGRLEPVHPDHVAYYSYSTLKVLVDRYGFDMGEFYFYDVGREHRPFTPWYLKAINDISVAVSPQLSDGIIGICSVKS
jgi:SAM-dependent methyltransferase